MDCSLPGSSLHGISQARILKWVAISFCWDLLDPGVKPKSLALQVYSLLLSCLGSLRGRLVLKKSGVGSSWPWQVLKAEVLSCGSILNIFPKFQTNLLVWYEPPLPMAAYTVLPLPCQLWPLSAKKALPWPCPDRPLYRSVGLYSTGLETLYLPSFKTEVSNKTQPKSATKATKAWRQQQRHKWFSG